MAAMRFEQVPRFILAKKKKIGGYGHSKDPTHYSKRVRHRVPDVVV